MIKLLFIFILLPIFLFSNPITTVYDCDKQGAFYLKVVGDFPDNDVRIYAASLERGYKWDIIAKPEEIHFFRDKLIVRDGHIIIESPSEGITFEGWWGYKGDVKVTKDGITQLFRACVVTFE